MPPNALHHFFQPLQAAVMRAVWAENYTVKAIWQHVRENYKDTIAYGTITTTLVRLTKSGALTRFGARRDYQYAPIAPNEQAYIQLKIDETVQNYATHAPKELGNAIKKVVKK